MEFIRIEKNMREAVNKIEEIGKQYAEAKGTSYLLQEQKKVVLARIMSDIEGSVASREVEARASDRYEEHLVGTKVAIVEELKLKAEYEKWKAQYETCRSLLSMEKAKANL